MPNFIFTNLIAAFPEDIIPVVGIVMVFGIPLVAILTSHQRKMAELMRGNHAHADINLQRQLEIMQAQINDLRAMMQEHIIKNDSSARLTHTPPPAPTSIEQRLNG